MTEEFLNINNLKKVENFIDEEIGLEYDATQDEETGNYSLMVFGMNETERIQLVEYLNENNLW